MAFDALAYINKDGAPLGKFNIELDNSQLRLISTVQDKKKKSRPEIIAYNHFQIVSLKDSKDKIELKIAIDNKRRQKLAIRLVNKKLHKALRQCLGTLLSKHPKQEDY